MEWVNILDKKEKNIIAGEYVFVMFYSGYIREVEVAFYAGDNKFFIRHNGQDISDLVIHWMKIENPLLTHNPFLLDPIKCDLCQVCKISGELYRDAVDSERHYIKCPQCKLITAYEGSTILNPFTGYVGRMENKMPKYKVYVNAGIEIWDEVEAENEHEAHEKAYALIGHRDYDCNIEVTKVDE